MSRIQADLHQHHQNSTGSKPEMIRRVLPSGRRLNICIVGAGVAGLRAADVLTAAGAQVTIYEARNRIGGRLAQGTIDGHLVDLGPNWIHGTENNPILNIAHQTKTTLHTWPEKQFICSGSGAALNEETVSQVSTTFWDLMGEAFAYSSKHGREIPAYKSLLGFLEDKIGDKFKAAAGTNTSSDELHVAAQKRNLVMQQAEMWGAFVGSPLRRQSLRFLWLEECIGGKNPFVAGTYQRILETIAKPAETHAKLLLSHKVKHISLPDSGSRYPTIEVESDSFKWQRGEDLDAAESLFDEVIVTSPLGYLKKNHETLFQSQRLPPRLIEAIENIGYGSLDKVYITFPSAFWQNACPGFLQWQAPKYAPETNSSQWMQEGMNLGALPGPNAHPTLLFYVFGDCAHHIARLAKATDASAKLLQFFEPYICRLPYYDASRPDCVPKAVLATAWCLDEFSGCGSYSNFQVGLEAGDEDIETMRRGVPERRLWLAGEHTAPFVALGTVTGAWWSGDGVARRILETYGLKPGLS